jgi:hypothetical protein
VVVCGGLAKKIALWNASDDPMDNKKVHDLILDFIYSLTLFVS